MFHCSVIFLRRERSLRNTLQWNWGDKVTKNHRKVLKEQPMGHLGLWGLLGQFLIFSPLTTETCPLTTEICSLKTLVSKATRVACVPKVSFACRTVSWGRQFSALGLHFLEILYWQRLKECTKAVCGLRKRFLGRFFLNYWGKYLK